MIKNLDNWEEYKDVIGSGSNNKIWLVKENLIGVFKYPKTKDTTEHFSEKLASDICQLINIPCAKIDIAKYKESIGCISYLINNNEEDLVEGIHYINKKYEGFTPNNSKDIISNEYYSLEMLLNSVKELNIEKNIIQMCLVDFIIGNSDRHQNNWAIIENKINNSIKFSPLYDNGSSLCCYIKNEDIDSIIKDSFRFNALVDSKSKTLIRIDKHNKKIPTHQELLKHIIDKYEKYVGDFVKIVNANLTSENIEIILKEKDYDGLSYNKKFIIKKFINEKIKILNRNYYERRNTMGISNKAYVIWQDTIDTRRKFIVGLLEKDINKFYFKYFGEVEEALKKGFKLFKPFQDIEKIYHNQILFPIFSTRLPDKKRKDINLILEKYSLKEYDEFNLLVKLGGKQPIDSLSFAEVIDNEGTFYLSGCRYYLGCKGDNCKKSIKDLKIGDELIMELEPKNIQDKNAIKVLKDNNLLGYIPRYYCKDIISNLKKYDTYELNIIEFDKESDCSSCIKVYIKFFNI